MIKKFYNEINSFQLKKGLFLLLSILYTTASLAQYPAGSPVAINGKLRIIGTKLSNECGNPVQLRGISSHGIQWFPNCYSTSGLDALTNSYKVDVFRLAMYVQEGGYVNNPTYWKNWIDNMVTECGKRGIYCMIDWHVLTPGDPMANINEAREFWTYMSTKHAGKKHVLYEICNEPNGVNWARVKTYADDIIPRIRANDPSTIVIVGTPTWSQDVDLAADNKLSYSNIMYALHFYSGTHTDWLRSKANTAISKGLALFVTEFGTSLASGDGGPFLAEGQKWIDWMAANDVSWINWSFADKAEISAILLPGSCGSNWNNTTASGTWLKQKLTVPADNFNCSGTTTTTPTPTINKVPLVSISSPTAGATINTNSIVINATGSDADGTISKVEFYNGSSKLGEDLTAPYSFTWNNVAVGTYSLIVKAIDNAAGIGTSSPVNVSVVAPTTINKAPVVAISAPLNNVSLIAPASLTIAANASDADGTISKVEFYNGSTKLGEDLTSPYNYAWSNIAAGTYSITARAIDNNLLSSSSSIIVVNVTTGTVTSGTAPSVSITSPLTSTSVPAPGRIVINANATDPNGRITKVEFYNGTTRLGQDTKKPYSYTWLNVPAGTYSITAKATDNQFLTTTSTIVVVNVTIPAITSTPTPTPVTSTPVPVTGGTTTNCTVLAIPSATEFSVTNSWSDQNMGSQVLNSADGLQIKHRQSGLDQLWVLRSGKPEVIEKGKTYAISFDFKNDVTNPVTNIALGFAYSLQWDGPVLIQSAVNASADFSSTNYTRKSVNIIATTSGNLNLSLSLKFQHQPTLTAISYLKNLSVCAIASSSLRSADFSSNHEIAPNPFAESTLIRINENETLPMHVVITDVAGRVIETTNEYSTNETMLLGSNLKPGVYYLKASYESNIKVIELLKE